MLHTAHSIADHGEETGMREEGLIVGVGESERILLGVAGSDVLGVTGQNAHSIGRGR
jgi:hypothetical protein